MFSHGFFTEHYTTKSKCSKYYFSVFWVPIRSKTFCFSSFWYLCPRTTHSIRTFSFIADTDSQQFFIDSGSNRIIVNDDLPLNHLCVTADKIKDIDRSPVRVTGGGKLNLTLKLDGGQVSQIRNLHAVLVPSTPYNLILPQLLVAQMKNRGFLIEQFYHNEKQYVFEYRLLTKHPKLLHNFTVPISSNGLFKFRAKTDYTSFICHASRLQPSFKIFCGLSHIIPNDRNNIFDYYCPVPPSTDK